MKHTYLLCLLVVLVGVLLFLLSSSVKDIRRFYTTKSEQNQLLPRHVTEEDIRLVAPWMTFAYVNNAFGIPPEFLKNELNISDTHYPNITIFHAAKDQAIDINPYLENMKSAMIKFFNH